MTEPSASKKSSYQITYTPATGGQEDRLCCKSNEPTANVPVGDYLVLLRRGGQTVGVRVMGWKSLGKRFKDCKPQPDIQPNKRRTQPPPPSIELDEQRPLPLLSVIRIAEYYQTLNTGGGKLVGSLRLDYDDAITFARDVLIPKETWAKALQPNGSEKKADSLDTNSGTRISVP